MYYSIDDIKKEFGLTTSDFAEIKSELRQLLQSIHPDKNYGAFKSDTDRIQYDKIISALDFMETSKLKTTNEITALTKVVSDLLQTNKSNDSILQYENDLSKRLENSIRLYQSSHLFPKITSSIITAIMTFIWLSPSSFADNPLLSKYLSSTSLSFSILWLLSLLSTGQLWYFLYRKERREQRLKSNLNLENTQNQIFQEFINWKVSLLGEASQRLNFNKTELIDFITNLRISRDEIRHEEGLGEKFDTVGNTSLRLILHDTLIDIELAQSLADLMIARAEKKGIIILQKSKSLIDSYQIDIENPL